MSKVDIEVFANKGGRSGAMYIATDGLGRLRMSSALVADLSLEDRPAKFYIGYDKGNRRIALGPVGVVKPTDAQPVTFDKRRHYASVRGFFSKYNIRLDRARYMYDGRHNGWYMFRVESSAAEDGRGRE